MRPSLTVFSWEQEPVYDRIDRGARAQASAGTAAPAPFAKNAVSAAAWEQSRDAPRESDRVLSSLAVQWRDGLPADLRPVHLCDRYPRIANRLALGWTDSALARLILGSLLQDKRGGRQGFPPDVAAELHRLRHGLGAAGDR